ncbi:MAG TPA: oxidoreductase [Gemmatimonadaceae bacterium]|nr:oxidoreductase [Gemmatimonadaceae bacterium]
MTTAEEIRVGLVGFGYVSKTFHVPLIKATEGYRIAAVASSRADDVKAALPQVDVVDNPEDLMRDDIDLVVIASPNDTHAPLAEMAMSAGRNVVVEKPFTITTAEARHLAAVSTETGMLLSVFQNRRWDSDFLTVQDAIREDLVGRISQFESRIDRYRPQVRDRWRENPGPGSGLLYDLGPHLIDQTLLLFGIPHSVHATLARQRDGAKTDDFFQLTMRYGEMIATLQASSLVSGGSARFIVHGARASLVKTHPDIQENQLLAGVSPQSLEWGVDPDNALIYEGATGQHRSLESRHGDQRGFYIALREALQGRAPNPVTAAEGAAIMSIIEAALQSDRERRETIPEVTDQERAAIESRRQTH